MEEYSRAEGDPGEKTYVCGVECAGFGGSYGGGVSSSVGGGGGVFWGD